MNLMRRLHFPGKMLLMGLMLTVPLAWLTAQALRDVHQRLADARTGVQGAGIAADVLDLTYVEPVTPEPVIGCGACKTRAEPVAKRSLEVQPVRVEQRLQLVGA